MGLSDQFLKPKYKEYLSGFPKLSNIRVAWLGQQDPNDKDLKNTGMFFNLSSLFDGHCQHDFYDIENKKSWDVHDEWKIKGYDLVLCFRLTYLVQSSSHLVKQLKQATKDNGIVLCDFVTGNIDKQGVMSWSSDNLICHLPEYYTHESQNTTYRVTSKEHLLDKAILASSGLELKNHTSFKGPKGRHYIIAKVESL